MVKLHIQDQDVQVHGPEFGEAPVKLVGVPEQQAHMVKVTTTGRPTGKILSHKCLNID